jgi:hypothetical protein
MAHQFNFGTGNIYALPVGGGAPVPFGSINGASIDFDGDVKMLYGSNQYPDDVAVGKRKITGKATFGRLDLNVANQVFFGQTVATGQIVGVLAEAGTVSAATPYTYDAANGATFSTDLGVRYASSGVQLAQVPATPAVGQYAVSPSGVYTFASGDAGKSIYVDYTYTSATAGYTLNGVNQTMGLLPTFQLDLVNLTKGKSLTMTLYSCVANKFSLPFKQEDYTEQEVDFSAFANGGGQVFTWSITGG